MADGSWYIDEDDPALARWHDGTGWTDYVIERADWEGSEEPPPPPGDLAWGAPGPPDGLAKFAAGVGAIVLVVLIGAVALAGGDGSDGGSSDGGSSGQTSTTRDRSTADLVSPLSGLGAGSDVLGTDAGTDSSSTDGTDGGSGTTVARRSGSTVPRTTTPAVQRTETRTESHTNTSPRTVPGPRDDTKIGNTSNTTIASSYTPPSSTVPPATTTTTAAPSDTTSTTEATTTGGQS